jgi:hypothetical protein
LVDTRILLTRRLYRQRRGLAGTVCYGNR